MGRGFDIFQKFSVKFPVHGQIIPVKCNQIFPPRAAHCAVIISQGWTQERHNNHISNKILKSFFILRCCITKDTRSCYSCNYIRFNHNPCYTAYNTETFKRKSTFCKFKYTILSNGYKESHFYKLTVIVANEPYTDQLYLQKSTWLLFTFVYFDTAVS